MRHRSGGAARSEVQGRSLGCVPVLNRTIRSQSLQASYPQNAWYAFSLEAPGRVAIHYVARAGRCSPGVTHAPPISWPPGTGVAEHRSIKGLEDDSRRHVGGLGASWWFPSSPPHEKVPSRTCFIRSTANRAFLSHTQNVSSEWFSVMVGVTLGTLTLDT